MCYSVHYLDIIYKTLVVMGSKLIFAFSSKVRLISDATSPDENNITRKTIRFNRFRPKLLIGYFLLFQNYILSYFTISVVVFDLKFFYSLLNTVTLTPE